MLDGCRRAGDRAVGELVSGWAGGDGAGGAGRAGWTFGRRRGWGDARIVCAGGERCGDRGGAGTVFDAALSGRTGGGGRGGAGSGWAGGGVARAAGEGGSGDLCVGGGGRMTVHFIGAGPGAADLITLRGRDLLAACSVCLYAGSTVSDALLAHCSAGTRVVDTAALSLDEIEAVCVEADAAGLDVARLHSGGSVGLQRGGRAGGAAAGAGCGGDVHAGVSAVGGRRRRSGGS